MSNGVGVEDISLAIPKELTDQFPFENKLDEMIGMVKATGTDEYDEYIKGARLMIEYIRKINEALDEVVIEVNKADSMYERLQVAITDAYSTLKAYETAVIPVVEEKKGPDNTVEGLEQYIAEMYGR